MIMIFLIPAAGLISTGASVISDAGGKAQFFKFQTELPKVCEPSASTSFANLRMGTNWHVFQFADFDDTQSSFINYILNDDGSRTEIGRVQAMEEVCNGKTCLCYVHVGLCVDFDCSGVGGILKSQCSGEEYLSDKLCGDESFVCEGGREYVFREMELPEKNSGDMKCCLQEGTNLFNYLFRGTTMRLVTQWNTLKEYVFSTQAEKEYALSELRIKEAVILRDKINTEQSIKDFTKEFLQNWYCEDQYIISQCMTLEQVSECTDKVLITNEKDNAVLAMPASPRLYNRISFLRDDQNVQIYNVEVFKRT